MLLKQLVFMPLTNHQSVPMMHHRRTVGVNRVIALCIE
jgi:hypothetical protein